MSSLSIMDFLTDKLLSYSSKMKGDTSRLTGSSNLMSDSGKLFSLNLLNGFLGDSSFNSETSNLMVPMKQSFGHNTGNNSFNFFHSFRPLTHLFNALMMDPYHFSHSTETFVPPDKILVSHIMNSVCLSRPTEMNPSLNCGFGGIEMPLPSVKTETKVSDDLSLTKKKDKVASKGDLPNFSTLNKELTNRKTKEMNKRSRNRRRRRKKNQQSDCNNPVPPSKNNEVNKIASSVTNLYLVSENPVFECTVSVSHPLQIASSVLSSFIIPVDASDDDDSEWESYDMNQFDAQSNKSGDNIPSSASSHIKSEKSKPAQSPECNFLKSTNFKSTFVVPVGSSEDESDLDCSSADLFHNLTEFQFTGLFVADFCSTPKTISSEPEDSIDFTDDEETVKIKALLREANKSWNEHTKGMDEEKKPKSQKVSFAPDDILTEVFPADVWERKGEWEVYATERLRFKRKIDVLEKVISPCLDPKHRSKIFKKLNKSVL